MIKIIDTGYRPRPLQDKLHRSLKRFNVLVLHRRAGKTIFSINELIDRGIRNPRKNPQVAYIAPTFGAAKRIAWNYLKEYLCNIPGVEFHEGELRATIPRPDKGDQLRIFLLGSENPAALRGMYLDWAIIDEFSESDPAVWTQVIRPALADRMGGAIFIFTPKGANHSQALYQYALKDTSGEWFACIYKASETGIIPQAELDSAKGSMTPEEYEQEFECSFSAALLGAYYKEEMSAAQKSGRIIRVPYDNHTFVTTGWDLGIDDSTAIWFMQECGRELHAIDYLEITGKGFPEITKLLHEKPYQYAKHILPHDVAVRELGTGKSRLEILQNKFKLKNIVVAPKLKIEDGIAAARSIMSKTWWDSELCSYGIECLKSYERKYDSKEGVFKSIPRHNWASHGADAWRTFATGYRLQEDKVNSHELETHSNIDYDVLGF